MIKVLIADDQELIRESLKIILLSKPDIEVTDAVCDGLEVIRSVREKRPDIILLDIRMPRLDGVSCTKIIKEGEAIERFELPREEAIKFMEEKNEI